MQSGCGWQLRMLLSRLSDSIAQRHMIYTIRGKEMYHGEVATCANCEGGAAKALLHSGMRRVRKTSEVTEDAFGEGSR